MKVTVQMSILVLTASVAVVAASDSHAQTPDRCVGLEAIALKPRGKLPEPVLARIRKVALSMEQYTLPASVNCGLIAKTIERLVDGKPIGGKRLEDDQPFDPAAAQVELDKAMQQEAGLAAQLAEVRSTTTDADERMVLEAAVLHEHGVFNARDLRLRQLVQKSGE